MTLEDLENLRKDIETCFGTSCNFCEQGCPFYQLLKKKTFTSRGRNRTILGIIEGKVKPSERMAETYFTCSLCGNCERWCALPNTSIARELRKYLVEQGFEEPAHKKNVENVKRFKNPYGDKDKVGWSEGLEFSKDGSASLFFAGCTMPLKEPETLRRYIEVLGADNFRLMPDEVCCGSYVKRTGYQNVYEGLEDELLSFAKKEGITEIVTACPGCYSTIREAVEENDLDIKVLHAVEKIAERVESGELTPEKIRSQKRGEDTAVIAYHDACHLGRLGGIFEAPRAIVKACGKHVEMRHNRYESKCCGSGGGTRAARPDLSREVGSKVVEEALEAGADILVTACPFCENQFKDVVETDRRFKGNIWIINIIELF